MNVIRMLATPAALQLAIACGGSAPRHPSSRSSAHGSPDLTSANLGCDGFGRPRTAWSKDMAQEQKSVVHEGRTMSSRRCSVFSRARMRHDTQEFGCTTCHGPAFAEPRGVSTETHDEARGTSRRSLEKPEIAKFMAESVVPKMASAMGLGQRSIRRPGKASDAWGATPSPRSSARALLGVPPHPPS